MSEGIVRHFAWDVQTFCLRKTETTMAWNGREKVGPPRSGVGPTRGTGRRMTRWEKSPPGPLRARRNGAGGQRRSRVESTRPLIVFEEPIQFLLDAFEPLLAVLDLTVQNGDLFTVAAHV